MVREGWVQALSAECGACTSTALITPVPRLRVALSLPQGPRNLKGLAFLQPERPHIHPVRWKEGASSEGLSLLGRPALLLPPSLCLYL